MLQLDFVPFPVLSTERFELRELHPGDVAEIFFLRSDPTVLKYIKTPPARDHEDALLFIKRTGGWKMDGSGIIWGIVPKNSPKVIGTICLWNIDSEKNKVELGYVLHPQWHGKGAMNEVWQQVASYATDVMKVEKVEAYTNKENTGSRKFLERNGFRRDKQLESEKVGKDEPEDCVIYTLKNKRHK